MGINRAFLLKQAKLRLFDGAMSKPQAVGILAILDRWERTMPEADDRWLAYMLATAHHETGRMMQPVRETFASSDAQATARLDRAFQLGKLTWVKTPYWRPDAEGKAWFGRGLVQITHKSNYEKLGRVIGVDLLNNPSLALDLEVAIEIMFEGMIRGEFTRVALRSKFNGSKEDWRGARAIINGVERADLVASYGKAYYGCISYTTS